MTQSPIRCLILACGNTLREDDGVGPWLAAWAEERFRDNPAIRSIALQQWTPELSEDIAAAGSVLFIDCAIDAAPGSVRLTSVEPGDAPAALATHHLGPAQLLSLSQELYGSIPRASLLLTIGAASINLREGFSDIVSAALPEARTLLEQAVARLLTPTPKP
jgi:hydrogenase maturation protease